MKTVLPNLKRRFNLNSLFDRFGFRSLVGSFLIIALTHQNQGQAIPANQIGPALVEVQKALEDWQLDIAIERAKELEETLPDVPPVQAVVAAVKFHQGDYLASRNLFERASEAVGDSHLKQLAMSTYTETQDFVSVESEHFIIRTPPGKDEILADIAIWGLEKAYQQLTKAYDYKPNHKIPVDILHDAKGLANVSSLTVKEIETSGTIALCKYNRLMITSPKAIARGYSWLDTLAHELVHLIISEKSRNTVPIWLHEGLAKYSESLWIEGPGEALDPYAENLLAKAVRSNSLITFEQMHPSMAKLPSQEDTALAFAEVFTVIEFLHKQSRPSKQKNALHGFEVTNRLLEELASGATMDDALKTSTGMNLEQLQKKWRRYLKNRAFRKSPHAVAPKKRFVKNSRSNSRTAEEDEDEATLAEARDQRGRKYARLGNLLRERGHLAAANLEYEKAVTHFSGHSPILHNRMAGIYLELKDYKNAKKILQKTVKEAPRDPRTQILLGRLNFLEENYDAALKHYKRATWENPFNPEIHSAFYRIGEFKKDPLLQEKARRDLRLLSSQSIPRTAPHEPVPGNKDASAYGTLSVHSSPWGRIIIDGHQTGRTTPLVDYQIVPGKHRIRVHDILSGDQEIADVEITPQTESRVQLKLQSIDDTKRSLWLEQERTIQFENAGKANQNQDPASDGGRDL
jgi:tetratricopeptide (TPR) repeat protein